MGESSVPNSEPSNFRTADFRSKKISDDRRRKFFRVVAKHAYPRQTAFEVRELTKRKDGTYEYGERAIYDWIAGRTDAPPAVFFKVISDIYD